MNTHAIIEGSGFFLEDPRFSSLPLISLIMPKKFQGQKMDLSEKPRGVKAMPEGFLNAPPPPPAATKNPMGKTDASPIVSPRSAPRWGQDLPPILDLNSGSEPAPADGEASEGAPPEAKAEEAPASAELVAMGPEERAAAVADALARLLAEGMGVVSRKETRGLSLKVPG